MLQWERSLICLLTGYLFNAYLSNTVVKRGKDLQGNEKIRLLLLLGLLDGDDDNTARPAMGEQSERSLLWLNWILI